MSGIPGLAIVTWDSSSRVQIPAKDTNILTFLCCEVLFLCKHSSIGGPLVLVLDVVGKPT